jgi:hypothetical protein
MVICIKYEVVLLSQSLMFIFEVGLGLWFVIKGVKIPEVKS